MVIEIKKEEIFYEANYDTSRYSLTPTKIFYADRLWELDKAVNEFIENITEKGFKVIAISVNTNKQEEYHYTTTIIYGIHIER